jgi:hypothetical protein
MTAYGARILTCSPRQNAFLCALINLADVMSDLGKRRMHSKYIRVSWSECYAKYSYEYMCARSAKLRRLPTERSDSLQGTRFNTWLFSSFISCIRNSSRRGPGHLVNLLLLDNLVSTVLLGDERHEVEDTAGVAPLLVRLANKHRLSSHCRWIVSNTSLSY